MTIMVHIKFTGNKKKVYAKLYEGNKMIKNLGEADKVSPEKMNYLKRKYGGKIKCK